MNHERWNERDRDTAENIICSIANDGMWFWALMELNRDTTGIPLDDIYKVDGNMANNRFGTDPYLELVRECQVVCMLELSKAGFTYSKIAWAMQCSDTSVSKRIRKHMEANR